MCEDENGAPLVLVHAESRRSDACAADAGDEDATDWCALFQSVAPEGGCGSFDFNAPAEEYVSAWLSGASSADDLVGARAVEGDHYSCTGPGDEGGWEVESTELEGAIEVSDTQLARRSRRGQATSLNWVIGCAVGALLALVMAAVAYSWYAEATSGP